MIIDIVGIEDLCDGFVCGFEYVVDVLWDVGVSVVYIEVFEFECVMVLLGVFFIIEVYGFWWEEIEVNLDVMFVEICDWFCVGG